MEVNRQGTSDQPHVFGSLLAQAQSGDALAWHGLDQFVRCTLREARAMRRQPADLVEEAVNHVLLQIYRNKVGGQALHSDAAARAWIEKVAKNYIRREHRLRRRRPRPASGTRHGADDDPGLLESCPAPEPTDRRTSAQWHQIVRDLPGCHAWAVAQLDKNRSRRVDYVAVYWLFFRARVGGMLAAAADPKPAPELLLGSVEQTSPWDDRIASRTPRAGWPTLGQVWQAWRRRWCREGQSTYRALIETISDGWPEARADAVVWHQWVSRVRRRLVAALVEQGNPFGEPHLAWKFWDHVLFGTARFERE